MCGNKPYRNRKPRAEFYDNPQAPCNTRSGRHSEGIPICYESRIALTGHLLPKDDNTLFLPTKSREAAFHAESPAKAARRVARCPSRQPMPRLVAFINPLRHFDDRIPWPLRSGAAFDRFRIDDVQARSPSIGPDGPKNPANPDRGFLPSPGSSPKSRPRPPAS